MRFCKPRISAEYESEFNHANKILFPKSGIGMVVWKRQDYQCQGCLFIAYLLERYWVWQSGVYTSHNRPGAA